MLSSIDIVRKKKKEFYRGIYKNLKNEVEKRNVRQNHYGQLPPNILIGSFGYPKVNFNHFVSAGTESVTDYSKLYGSNYSDVINNFTLTINARHENKVNVRSGLQGDIKWALLSSRPVYSESFFNKKPSIKIDYDKFTAPRGYYGKLKKTNITDNPKVPIVTEKLVSDDLKSVEGVKKIFKRTNDLYYTTRVFNMGVLGKKDTKRIVPTRWSITATDDILTKEWMKEIKSYSTINDITIFENYFLHNKFFVILLPGAWEYEQYEIWQDDFGKISYNREEESIYGRKKYADLQAGGYYAARYAVVEYLKNIRKQAKAIVIREIEKEYIIPVGVWQVRENVRNAFKKDKMKKFDNIKELIQYYNAVANMKVSWYKDNKSLSQKNIFDYC